MDRAATLNRRVVEDRLDLRLVRPRVRDFYEEAFAVIERRARA